MTLEKERITIGVFATRSNAQLAIQELEASYFPMHKVSVIARNVKEQSDIAGVEVKQRTSNTSVKDVAVTFNGEVLSDFSLATSVIPGIGKVTLAGTEATAIATSLTGGLSSLFRNLGISKEQARIYSDLVCKGYYLLIVTGIEMEISLAQRIFNHRNFQQRGFDEPYSTPNSRYKYAIGIFYTRQDIERAFAELTTAGFAMNQVSIVGKNISSLDNIFQVNISSSQYKYNNLGIPDDISRYYEHQVSVGHYLIVIKGTDIYLAGAKAILENNNIQYLNIHSQSEIDEARSDRQITTNF